MPKISKTGTSSNQSFFYACSCLSAKQLGKQIIDNGCKVFLGFDATISSCNPEVEGIYQDCENAFIPFFVNDGLTIHDCLKKVKEKYVESIGHIASYYSIFEASVLENNFNAFRVLCSDTSITKNEFM